jgi:hypothetical protein
MSEIHHAKMPAVQSVTKSGCRVAALPPTQCLCWRGPAWWARPPRRCSPPLSRSRSAFAGVVETAACSVCALGPRCTCSCSWHPVLCNEQLGSPPCHVFHAATLCACWVSAAHALLLCRWRAGCGASTPVLPSAAAGHATAIILAVRRVHCPRAHHPRLQGGSTPIGQPARSRGCSCHA